jgi:geranylgeranyl diphosphate synthase type II
MVMSDKPTATESDFKTKFKTLQNRVESAIDVHLPPVTTRPPLLHQAMRYSMEAGGKRLRPVLLLAIWEDLDGTLDPEPAAAAIECLHTYSLIHDDLPSMDDGDLRRGRPTCHRRFDEAAAILAGDALLTHAFALLGRAYASTPQVGIDLVSELGAAAGSTRLIGGQMEDILAESSPCSAERLRFIHENKTAALMSASTGMGAIAAEASADRVQTARSVGRHLGLAFQIIDDILDATGTPEELGKDAGTDAASQKNTFVSLFGIDAARDAAREETSRTLECLRQLPNKSGFVADLARWMEHRIK